MKKKDTINAAEPAAALLSRIKLTSEMKDAAFRAERDFEAEKCFSEADFKERFAKWL